MKSMRSVARILNLGTLSVIGTAEKSGRKAVVFMLTCGMGLAFTKYLRCNPEAVLYEALPYVRVSNISVIEPEDAKQFIIVFELELNEAKKGLSNFLCRVAERIVKELKARNDDAQLMREQDNGDHPYTLPRIEGSVELVK